VCGKTGMIYRCDTCKYLNTYEDARPYGDTTVYERVVECALGYDATVGDCPDDTYDSGDYGHGSHGLSEEQWERGEYERDRELDL